MEEMPELPAEERVEESRDNDLERLITTHRDRDRYGFPRKQERPTAWWGDPEEGVVMTAKCANPGCTIPFHYFRSGKIYLIDTAISSGGTRSSSTPRDVEYFWLCGDCSRNMQVTLDRNGLVVVVQMTGAGGEESILAPLTSRQKVVSSAA